MLRFSVLALFLIVFIVCHSDSYNHPFHDNVKVTYTEAYMIVKSEGLPDDHSTGIFPNDDNPSKIQEQSYMFRIPLHPIIDQSPQYAEPTDLPMGPIGIALNGVPFFNPFAVEGKDAVKNGIFDSANGHPNAVGQYHYHQLPKKLREIAEDTVGGHSPTIGYAFDGFTVYGPNDSNGHPPNDLDNFNGHQDAARGYHYHITSSFPYILGGYKGLVEKSNFRSLEGSSISIATGNRPPPQILKVTVVSKTTSHPYLGQGISSGFAIDGVEGKELNLEKGIHYLFGLSDASLDGHPLYISTSSIGGSDPDGNALEPYVSSGTSPPVYMIPDRIRKNLVFIANPEAITFPQTLYYQCKNHRYMGYKINIIDTQAIEINDWNFRHHLRQKLNKPDTPNFSEGDVAGIEKLDLSTTTGTDKVSNLDGIKEFRGLRELHLDGNQVQDLNQLHLLLNLEKLDLGDLRIGANPVRLDTDIKGKIDQLPNLRELGLRGQQIQDADLQNLELDNLEELNLEDNQIHNLDSIEDVGNNFRLPRLKRLKLDKNPIENIDTLNNHPYLEELSLDENNSTKDVNPLFDRIDDLPRLRRLGLKKCRFTKVDALHKFSDTLVELDLSQNQIQNSIGQGGRDTDPIKPLRDFTTLRYLDLSQNKISDIQSIIDLAQAKHGLPSAVPPRVSAAPALAMSAETDLTVNLSDNPVESSQISTLQSLGVTVLTDTSGTTDAGTFTLHLDQGLNMISLPNKPLVPFAAKTFCQKLSNDPITDTLETDRVTLLIRFDSAKQQFDPYIWAIDKDTDGFAIDGGQGYIVNLLVANDVGFNGTVWKDTAASPPIIGKDVISPVWAFVVVGHLPKELLVGNDGQLTLRMTDLISGKVLKEEENLQPTFRLTMVDQLRLPVVGLGDQIQVEVFDSKDRPIASSQLIIQAEALNQAYAQVYLVYNPIPDFSRLLQNYPNPFNPETWIPFELSQETDITLSIYDAVGDPVRSIQLGIQAPGLYRTKDRAVYWDGKNEQGESVASGVYFYRLNDLAGTRKMLIVK